MSEFEEYYDNLCKAFGVYHSRSWDDLHLHFSPHVFCEANRPIFIAEYLVWKDFVEIAKEHNIPYYWGIDKFLEEYKSAVENRVRLD